MTFAQQEKARAKGGVSLDSIKGRSRGPIERNMLSSIQLCYSFASALLPRYAQRQYLVNAQELWCASVCFLERTLLHDEP